MGRVKVLSLIGKGPQIVRLDLANGSGVTTEFWQFDFFAYLSEEIGFTSTGYR